MSRTRFFGAGGVIGFVWPNADVFDVRLGALHLERTEAVSSLVADWPDSSF